MIKRVAIPTALMTVSVFLPVGLTSLAQQTQSTSQQTQSDQRSRQAVYY